MTNKFILIYPPITRAERYSSKFLGAAGGSQVPLGVLYIASYLLKFANNEYDVKFIDSEHEGLSQEDTIDRVRKYIKDEDEKKCYIGLTSTTVCFNRTLALAQKLKKVFPNIKIILGGAHVSAVPEHALSFDCFDYGIIGEGELTTFELLECLRKNDDISQVDGIVYNRDGELIYNKPRKQIKHLDELPFPGKTFS